ncbi:MAG: carbon storage regulator CsrA [Firmicutes bacterium]|nr:carbon storage regulator CsrA [Bacillota bacterium]
MLILSRKLNEEIVIGDGITISVLAIEGDKVSLGIDAPSDFKILRKELLDAVKSNNKQSADISAEQIGKLKNIFADKGKKG